MIEIDGKKMIICYSMSKITGWISAVVFPPDKLIEPMIPEIRSYTIYLSALLAFISTIFAYILSFKITNPISKLAKAIKKTGEGRFDLKIREEGSSESRELIRRFNIMNEEIQKLIIENYEIKIKEKEAEINALNLQLDPHFMYNTLNLINLISIENGQDEISEMIISLSQMLKYTVKNRESLVPFKLDIQYLKSYIFIMTKRLEGKFTVLYDIDPELDEYYVPKFFLQPFVENAIIHAFDSDKKGILRISCRIHDGIGIHYIEDNGKGISSERIKEIFDPKKGAVGINNVDKRIKAMFGNEYGVFIESVPNMGTKITITHPLKSSNI
jgi:two-component system sensor histidine kinase YesM